MIRKDDINFIILIYYLQLAVAYLHYCLFSCALNTGNFYRVQFNSFELLVCFLILNFMLLGSYSENYG